MATVLASTDNSLESELERAEQLQKKDVPKAEEAYRAVLNRKARKYLPAGCQLMNQRTNLSSNVKKRPCSSWEPCTGTTGEHLFVLWKPEADGSKAKLRSWRSL